MRKGGFNMYLTKEKKEINLYQGYQPKLPGHQEVEAQVYISHAISGDISKHMQTAIRSMSSMVVRGLVEGGEDSGRK